jgi:hypothetical protein
MPNRIKNTRVEIRRLSAAEAEVWITAELEAVTAATELRGKLTGPRCPGVTTVEVAYPLGRLPGSVEAAANTLTVRALIPEPNLWTRATPFVYDCRLELWQNGVLVDQRTQTVGLKQST